MKKHAKKIITALLVVAMLVPTIGMLYSSAAQSYTVELAFNNLFVFEQWASSDASTYVRSDGTGGSSDGSLDVNIENGSFRLTNKTTTTNVYTTASMTNKDNIGFYSMPVEENCTYSLSYNVSGSNLAGFFPFVFFYYGESKEPTFQNGAASNLNGDNTYVFTVPAGATHIQLRFQIPNNTSISYADVKDIAVYKVDTVINQTNLFNFSTWSTKTGSGGGDSVYAAGTRTINADEGSVTLTSNGANNLGGCSSFLTGFALGAYDNTHFTIDTQPGKTYSLSYELVDTTLNSVSNATVLIPWYNSSNTWINSYGDYAASEKGTNTYTFTVPADVYHFQVVVGIYDWSMTSGKYATVKNIEIHEVLSVPHKVEPVRKAYTYSGGSETYGSNLPTPPAAIIPENYIFAGWYTGENGTGIRIAADTPVQPQSYTVYPKFEPAVDSLTVATMPTKTEYTKGEKLNTTGLVLKATILGTGDTNGDGVIDGSETVDTTFNITSGYYWEPEYLTTAGTQTITVHYGGKTATFTVNVSNGKEKNIVVNGATHPVTVANNEYTLNYQATAPFNRYEMTYFSDSYVKGEIVMDGITEEFFLEPSDNGSFASYIDSFLRGIKHYSIESIKFTCLNKEFGNFELLSVTTLDAAVPGDSLQFYENSEYKVGIDLAYGGVVSYIEDLKTTDKGKVTAAVYTENGKDITRVDYADKLPSGAKATSSNVNLINTNDRGRYLQQSYYGTNQKPYEMGDYNGVPWNYNPVQGGNLQIQDKNGNVIKGNESSKVIDYRITNDQIYIKTRPLDWGKNSEDYPDSYVTDSYMEAWYVFEDGMIKTYCRFVDYSGYPANTTTQEMPALYTIEPLNHFVYNNVDTAWSGKNFEKIEEPDFWGVLPEYNDLLQANGKPTVKPDVIAKENWAAFAASNDEDSFGIGVYSPGVENMHYGVFPAIYNEETVKNSKKLEENYRHTASLDPAVESPTSYISPVDVYTFESYSPKTYSFYITTGTAEEIYNDFKTVANKDNQAEQDKSKIAVPETVYMTPANGASKVGQYYVNNIMDESLNNKVVTEAKRDAGMYLGLSIKDAKEFSVKVTNVTDPDNDIFLCNTSGSEISESTRIQFGAAGTYKNDREYGLRFSGEGLQPGEKATAKWEITVYKNDGTSEVFTAYTVMYAPGRTVGAVAEARQVDNSQNEISSWITGANGVDHTKQAPLGSLHADYRNFGYFKSDPLYNENAPSGGSGGTSNDYINVGSNANEYYVMQAATNGHDGSRAQSYLGLLTVDKSRYTSTNQIPNLEIGFDALRVGSWKKDSLDSYKAYYTLGTSESFTATDLKATPSGWTQVINAKEYADSHTPPYRETFIPDYKVSDIDGKYIHALNQGAALQTAIATRYSTAGTSVLCSVTDKSELRDAVLNGYTIVDDDPDFVETLENAATVLGDPSASQEEIDEAKKELSTIIDEVTNVYYALKYDNLFSAYEYSLKSGSMTANRANASVEYLKDINGIKVTSDNVDNADVSVDNGNNPDTYYNIDVKGSTEYIFEYDVESTKRSQLHLFFFDTDSSTPSAWLAPTNRTYTWTPEGGATQNHTQSSGDFANVYADGNGHVVMRFTTPANADRMAFRFGNTESVTMSSTFSNIKLVEANKYYADVEYEKTEDVYKEYASYGILPTLTRLGYTFGGWKDAEGKTVTGADIATEHKSIFSVWTIVNYTITYNANDGNVSPASQSYTVENTLTLPTPSRDGYIFQGWKVTKADGSWAVDGLYKAGEVPAGMYGNVTLTAQWSLSEIPVYFDTILDFDDWNTKTANNATISNVTANGFTLTSNVGAGEGTSTSPEFPVTPGKQYYIDIDVTDSLSTPKWDVYIFFYDENTHSGTGLAFSDGKNRFSGDGNGVASRTFTAPSGAVNAVIRLDANEASHSVTFSDIRVYEAGTRAANVNVPDSSRTLQYGETFGTLPVPTREGFTFKGWFDENGNQVTAESTVNYTSAVYLKSKWVINNSSLVSDEIIIDFGSPVSFAPLANDTAFMNAAKATGNSYKFLGFSKEGSTALNGTYGAFSISGENVTYTPSKTVDGVETVTYYASLTENGVATTVESTITVAPASNVLYEENRLAVSNQNGVAWSTVKEESVAANGNQAVSDKNDVYGYDKSYATAKTYSNNSALSVSLTNTNRTSQNLSFDFTGTGFDLYSACGPTTGIQILTVKNSEGKATHAAIVDTYYSDSNYGTLYQVPIVSIRDLDYGSYTVQVAASYLTFAGALNNASSQSVSGQNGMISYTAPAAGSQMLYDMLAELGMTDAYEAEEFNVIWFDENSIFNGGSGASASSAQNEKSSALSAQVKNASNGAAATADEIALINVIDSFRVYNPIENGDDYYIASEKGAQYYNVMDNLINGGIVSGEGQFAYVSGKDQEAISPDTYDAIGPKDELYLSPRTGAVVFSIGEFNKESSRVMVSLRAASGTPNVKIGGVHHEVTSNTEMYYDISEYVAPDGTVTIENGGSGNSLLAVGTVKITGTAVTMLSTFNLDTVRAMIAAPSVEVDLTAPKAEEEVTPPEDDVTPPDDDTNPGDDTNVDDTNDGNGNTDDGSDKKCSIMQFFLWLIELFKKILSFISNIFSI